MKLLSVLPFTAYALHSAWRDAPESVYARGAKNAVGGGSTQPAVVINLKLHFHMNTTKQNFKITLSENVFCYFCVCRISAYAIIIQNLYTLEARALLWVTTPPPHPPYNIAHWISKDVTFISFKCFFSFLCIEFQWVARKSGIGLCTICENGHWQHWRQTYRKLVFESSLWIQQNTKSWSIVNSCNCCFLNMCILFHAY